MLDRLEHLVVLTLAYTDQFSYPLSLKEIQIRLVGSEAYSLLDVTRVVERLRKKGVVARVGDGAALEQDQLYALRGARGDGETKRVVGKAVTDELLQRAWPLVWLCALLPWVRALVVTGSAAMESARPGDDLDFLVVVAPQRLWLARMVVVGWAWVWRRRRSWGREEPGSWCFNLWLEPAELRLRRRRHTTYTAYELCQARWLIDKDSLEKACFAANRWVRHRVAGFWQYRWRLAQKKIDEKAKKATFLV